MDDDDDWDVHNVASLASNPFPTRKQQPLTPKTPAAEEEDDLFEMKAAAERGSIALRAAAAAELDDDDDDMVAPKRHVRKLSAAEVAHTADTDELVAAAVAKAIAEEARKAKEAQARALAAQAAQAARLHKEKLQEALQAQHAALHDQMLQGTLPPPRQATWSESLSASLSEVLPGAKSFFDIFGVAAPGNQLASLAAAGPGGAESVRALGGEAAAAVAAASAQWQQEKAALEERVRLAEERANAAEERAKAAEAKAEGSALALIEARGRQTVAASRASATSHHALAPLTTSLAVPVAASHLSSPLSPTSSSQPRPSPHAAASAHEEELDELEGLPEPSASSLADLLADMEETTTKAAERHLGVLTQQQEPPVTTSVSPPLTPVAAAATAAAAGSLTGSTVGEPAGDERAARDSAEGDGKARLAVAGAGSIADIDG